MAYDPVKKASYDAKYREKNKEAIAEKAAQFYKENKEVILKKRAQRYEYNKENISYIITVGSGFYFGHSSAGLDARRYSHFKAMRISEGCPGLQKLFDDLGEEAFTKAFDMQIIGTFETVEEAKTEEAYLLTKYVGTPRCLNVRLT